MIRIFLGLILGITLTLGGIALLRSVDSVRMPNWLEKPTPTATTAAGTKQNYSETIDATRQLPLTLALSDRFQNSQTNRTNLLHLEVTFGKAEVALVQTDGTTGSAASPISWEVLNLRQPTVDLFALRGSTSLAELGTTTLANGTYGTLRLTVISLKGTSTNGDLKPMPLTSANEIIELPLSFTLTAGEPTQLIIDMDTIKGILVEGIGYQFVPVIDQVLINDTILR